jgi:excisionase family DNA binding protein
MNALLTIAEFAARIRVSRSMAYKIVDERLIRHVRIGSKILIPEDAVPEYLRACEVAPVLESPAEARPKFKHLS